MRFPAVLAVFILTGFALSSCHPHTVVPTPRDKPTLTVPSLPEMGVALRLFIAGDGGEPGPRHDVVFDAIRKLSGETALIPAVLLMPGDLTYPAGLSPDCRVSLDRLKQDYLLAVPKIPIFAVPGNHDHGYLDLGTNPIVAGRVAYFDCNAQPDVATVEHWTPASCPCDSRWHDPAGLTNAGSWPLLPASMQGPGLTLIAYDSQAALSEPDSVAAAVERLFDQEPPDRRIVLMAHHPLATYGPHGSEERSAQNVTSAPYRAYAERFSRLVRARENRILLLVFGHDHNLQYLPGSPPALISGAASKTSPLGALPAGALGEGGTPGFAVVDFFADGKATLTLIWSGPPDVAHLAATGG